MIEKPPLQHTPPIIILDRPAHPGNIGAAARAMANMGFKHLRIVNPKQYPHQNAIDFAAGGVKILDNAKIFTDLNSALADLNYIVATTNRNRGQRQEMVPPRELGEKLLEVHQRPDTKIGILFGTERTGLESIDVERADLLCNIPTAGDMGSLNLAQAVLVVTYEVMIGMKQGSTNINNNPKKTSPLATAQDMERFFNHLEETLLEIGFIKPKQKKHMMGSLKAIYHRAAL
ncbi:MAG: RNA methyltransferase, partial [Magnetococcales bacterium]|nr:RNA methyltransferase [Magnetococcales bacterium]